MAVLGATTLTGCTRIPGFLPGTADVGITTASRMVFQNATCPVSWTKETGYNEGMLRVVSAPPTVPGTPVGGGSLPFSQTFTTRPYSGTLATAAINLTINPATASPPTTTPTIGNISPGTTSSVSLTTTHAQPHSHTYSSISQASNVQPDTLNQAQPTQQTATTSTVGGTAHSHSWAYGYHNHSFTAPSTHTHTDSGTHSHTLSGSLNFAVLYVDMIIARKD